MGKLIKFPILSPHCISIFLSLFPPHSPQAHLSSFIIYLEEARGSHKLQYYMRLGRTSFLTIDCPLQGDQHRMSHRNRRETKQHLIWWPDLALFGGALFSLYFLCYILSSLPVEDKYLLKRMFYQVTCIFAICDFPLPPLSTLWVHRLKKYLAVANI